MERAAVLEVIARDGGDDDVLERRIRRTASATRWGSSASSAKGLAVDTAQKPQARVQRSPAIMNVAVPWLQHSQRLGHCALSHTVCNFRSETSALVEKNTGLLGSRTLIQSGFFSMCREGSIFAQDMTRNYAGGRGGMQTGWVMVVGCGLWVVGCALIPNLCHPERSRRISTSVVPAQKSVSHAMLKTAEDAGSGQEPP